MNRRKYYIYIYIYILIIGNLHIKLTKGFFWEISYICCSSTKINKTNRIKNLGY